MKILSSARPFLTVLLSFVLQLVGNRVFANIPGGGTNGPNVTLTDNGDGTVTIANGTVSIHCNKSSAVIDQINYTFNNSGTVQTINLVSGNPNGGKLYWENSTDEGLSFTYTIVADPGANGGNYAEIALFSTTVSGDELEVHYSMLRGNSGFYVTPIWFHQSADAQFSLGECRDNIYAGSIFNWMSVDAERNRFMETQAGTGAIGVLVAPVEVSLWTNGVYSGRYEDKYKYSADLKSEQVWGWSSVGTGGQNVGLWDVMSSAEYYPGGPMKRELICHIGTTILNMAHGSHYGGGTDATFGAGEFWGHVFGPHFIYCDNISNTITDTNTASQTLRADALAQASAEQSAWPYSWFNNTNYTLASGRGTVSGQIAINDVDNPNASASNLWVGVVQQPITLNGEYDFQTWCKTYQFWTRTDSNGNFTLPNVIAGTNYTLYAFGAGAAGTFQSQPQSGGSAPNELDIPASPFSVTVTAGVTNDLGSVIWTPRRVGPTVFEIGFPDRTGDKFRHGEDWWVGDIGPSASAPSPIWSKWLEYPFDFPNGPNYTVGSSRWTTDWNFVQPVVTSASGAYNNSSSTITFNLPSAPTASGSLYLALSSDFQSAIIISVNGSLITSSAGYGPAYSSSSSESDTTIREGIHGMFSDNRISVPSSDLKQGQNTITISIRQTGGSYFADHAMYDYVRLELPGYVPPAPANAAAYAGNNCNLISWPVTPGATGYNVLRTTTSGSGYVSVTNGVVGPVCGSGWNNATFLDTTAENGTTYYYVVQSVNSAGASGNSPESSSAMPTAANSTSAPSAPGTVSIGGATHQSVTVNWSAAANASFYTVYRSTLFDNGGGGSSNVLGTIVLANNVTGTSYTDGSPTDGSTYGYFVTATGPGGTSAASVQAVAVPLPTPPATAPGSLTGVFSGSDIFLNWAAVPGAVGYVISRSTSPSGPFNLLMSVTETTYADTTVNAAVTYYYRVIAMNAAGVSTNASVAVVPPPAAPSSLSAIPGNGQVLLNWTSVPGVTGYYLYRGTTSGAEDTVVVGNYSGTSFTDTGLVNGTTYYYVVASTNSNGLGPDSPEASATPSTSIPIPRTLTWRGDGAANVWDVDGASNWVTNNVATLFNNGDTAIFDNTGSNNVPVSVANTPQPALVVFNATKSYTLGGSGSISGASQLIKMGSGTLTINNTNLYSGGTVISNSTVLPGNIGANGAAWGSGPIILMGGTVQFNGYGGSTGTGWGGATNTINVPSGKTGTLLLPPRWGYSSPFTSALTGGGTLNVTVDYVRDYFSGDWSAFTGRINVTPRSGTGDFRIDNSAGYASAALFLNNGVNLYNINANNETIDIGELGGTTNAFIGAGSVSSSNPTWRIGAKNTTNTYAGVIADAGVTSLIKTGTGMFVVSGANNTYSGGTTVNGGILMVSNSVGSATGLGAVNVSSGGTLAGSGIIGGAVTINSGGAFSPGSPLGTLTLSNSLTLAPGSTTFVQLEHLPLTNDVVNVLGALAEGGTLNVTNIGVAALANGDSFRLFNAAGYSGAFVGYVLPPLTGDLRWNTSALNSSGVLSVIMLTSPTITNLQMVNGSLVMSGSGGVSNWPYYVLASTNLSLPTAQWTPIVTNQFDGSGNFVLTNAISAASPQMFYQIQLR